MRRSKIFLFIGAFPLIFGLVFGLTGAGFLGKDAEYAQSGVKVSGTIKSKRIEERWNSEDRRTDNYYHLTYSFLSSDGKEIEKEAHVGYEEYVNAEAGQSIEVEYLPSEPASNRLASNDERAVGYIFCGIGLFLSLLGGSILFYDIRARLRARRLLQYGSLTNGKVTAIEYSGLTINDIRQWRIRYSYKDQMGRPYDGVSESMSPSAAEQWKEGDAGQIRYDKTNPKLSLWLGKHL